MPLILAKTDECSGEVCTTVTVSSPTQFTFTGARTLTATIYFNGAVVEVLTGNNPIYLATANGEYEVCIGGTCGTGSLFSDPAVCCDVSLEGDISVPILERQPVCCRVDGQVAIRDGYAVLQITSTATTVLRIEDALGNVIVNAEVVDCDCPCLEESNG